MYATLAILDVLDFGSLVNLANTNDAFRELIGHHYMQLKYNVRQKTIFFKYDHVAAREFSAATIRVSDDQIAFSMAREIVPFIRSFGAMIEKFELTGKRLNALEMEEIVQHIKSHCTESLTEITLSHLNGRLFVEFPRLPRVHSLTMREVRNAADIQIDRLFPRMRSLTALLDDQNVIVERHFPHLTDFKVRFGSVYAQNPAIERILRLNAQIVSFNCENFLRAAMVGRLANGLLPNLRELALISHPLSGYTPAHGPFHFANISAFKLTLFNLFQDQPDAFPFHFDRSLKSMVLMTLEVSDAWIEFIALNENLESVQVPMAQPTYAQLSRLIGRLPRLRALSLAFYTHTDVSESVVRIMGEDNRIDAIAISLPSTMALNELLQHVPISWKLVSRAIDAEQILMLTFERWRG